MSWIDNIVRSRALASGSGLVNLAAIVSGSSRDSAFWATALDLVKRDVLSADKEIPIIPLSEETPAGNFLGTLKAWSSLCSLASPPETGLSLISMVFGQGRRFSPFTQALGNRKAAFPTPCRGVHSGAYLRTGDLALLYSSLWLDHLSNSGFNGALVKWGDEAAIPSSTWKPSRLKDVDIVRFVWKTRPTEVLAKEKEWFVLDEESGLIERLIPRQPFESLSQKLSRYQGNRYSTAVNLGSLAVSYNFLNIARKVLAESLSTPARAADWDPVVMMLLLTGEDEDPTLDGIVARSLSAAETRCPGLLQAMKSIRAAVRSALGRELQTAYLDFGDALWIDLGLHTTLRNTLDALTADDPHGQAVRALFGIQQERDANGNIITGSQVHANAKIRDSVIIDSTLSGPNSVVEGGVVVGSRHEELLMPSGGASLFCAAQRALFSGRNGIAFRSVEPALDIPPGGRHTTFFAGDTPIPLRSNESIQRYEDAEYSAPILGNEISFEEAGRRAAALDPWVLEERWARAARSLPADKSDRKV